VKNKTKGFALQSGLKEEVGFEKSMFHVKQIRNNKKCF
jgi:hypothetical protein